MFCATEDINIKNQKKHNSTTIDLFMFFVFKMMIELVVTIVCLNCDHEQEAV